ncbi:sulfotransferase domain-containing protein [Thiogranum longum]|uniref:Sulfotransferase domain-containing protein n=1 Tax=Thiogranum longum TaxID=1537524 RepID=A0A4R1HGP8_9GAMM|nr:sulfotransferase [Thiogranum longum]TCK19460.1 sulfotransferase domain-containing protein [Thiogranum longum]
MEKFVILSDRRSGTTLLIDALTSHPDVSCVKRAFGQERRIKNPTPDHHSGTFFLYRTANLTRRLQFHFQRVDLIRGFLNDEIFASPPDKSVKGFRLIYAQAEQYPELVKLLQSEQLKVIHLVRENILKTYISTITAPLHKMHHPRTGDTIKIVTIRLDPAETLAQLEKRAGQIQRMRNIFSSAPYLEVSYENFSADREKESERILPFLGLHNESPLHSDLVKINPDSLRDIIENYSEIEDALKNTAFEHLLS